MGLGQLEGNRLIRLFVVVRLGIGLGFGGTLGRQTEPVTHLLAHVSVTSALVVGHSLDAGSACGDLVSGRQLAVLDFEDVSSVGLGFLGPDVSMLVGRVGNCCINGTHSMWSMAGAKASKYSIVQ